MSLVRKMTRDVHMALIQEEEEKRMMEDTEVREWSAAGVVEKKKGGGKEITKAGERTMNETGALKMDKKKKERKMDVEDSSPS